MIKMDQNTLHCCHGNYVTKNQQNHQILFNKKANWYDFASLPYNIASKDFPKLNICYLISLKFATVFWFKK